MGSTCSALPGASSSSSVTVSARAAPPAAPPDIVERHDPSSRAGRPGRGSVREQISVQGNVLLLVRGRFPLCRCLCSLSAARAGRRGPGPALRQALGGRAEIAIQRGDHGVEAAAAARASRVTVPRRRRAGPVTEYTPTLCKKKGAMEARKGKDPRLVLGFSRRVLGCGGGSGG